MSAASFSDLHAHLRTCGPVRLAIAGGDDENVCEAVKLGLNKGLISHAYITGKRNRIAARFSSAFESSVTIIDADSPADSAAKAVALVKSQTANVLMKGAVDSASYLRAIMDRSTGIRQSNVLSNVTVAAMPSYPKLLAVTDNGIIPTPDLDQKVQIIQNTRNLFRGLGLNEVKVAVVATSEKVSDKFPATVDAASLVGMSKRGELPGFVVDGPFGYDAAIDSGAAKTKNLEASPVAGDADLLLFPNIEAANAVAKSWKYHGQADTGSVVLGASVPVLLNSRSDSAARRINAILLAVAQNARITKSQ